MRKQVKGGQRFGRLVAIAYSRTFRYSSKATAVFWVCHCDCGVECEIRSSNLLSNHTRSCGCLERDLKGQARVTHGQAGKSTRTAEYKIWSHLRDRCENPKSPAYSNYGGRGITVCERWRKFENFFEDMSKRPSARYSIERINNNEGYSKENCRWATRTEQNRNTRTNVFIEWNGKRKVIAEWCSELGCGRTTIHNRLRRGWSLERTMSTPFRTRRFNRTDAARV